tara:strand:+ start:3976 stop:5016 length:1041 start_codon:yes stop_codon:yes gene_type:complete
MTSVFYKIKVFVFYWFLFLFPIHVVFIWLKNFFYDYNLIKPKKTKPIIVSIGNVSLGGTGKTPFTIAIAKLLTQQGYKVGVSTRGHGRKNEKSSFLMKDKNWFVKDFYKHWKVAGDETVLLKNNLENIPVYVSKNKTKAAESLYRKEGCDVVLLDDGFQHRKLYRDVDIVLFDHNEKANKIFPYGVLREPIIGLKRADIIISTNMADNKEGVLALKWGYNDYLLVADSPENKAEKFEVLNQYSNILSLCAIGSPGGFQKTLESLKINFKESLVYPDHYPFKEKDIKKINSFVDNNKIDLILCTEKDLIKLKQYKETLGAPIAAITINYSLSPSLEKGVLDKIRGIV